MKNLNLPKGSNKLGLVGHKSFLFFVMLLIFKNTNSQTLFREIFELELNSPQELEYSSSVLASSDLFTVGNTWNSDAEKTNIVTTKTNGSGGVVWQTEYNGSQSKFDYGAAIALDGSGNIYVAGATNTSSATTFDVVVIKYNSSGTQQWATTYNGTGSDNDIPSAILINGSDIYVCAASIGSGTGYDFITMKLTTSGTITWSSRYDYNSLYDLPGYLAMQSSNIVVTGGSQSTTTNWDYAAVKYNSSGTQVATIRSSAAGYGFDRPTGLVKDASDKFYITGYAYNGVDYDMRTIKLDDDLSPVWTVTEDEGDEDGGNSICIDGSANTYIAGFATNGSGRKEMKIVKYNSSGTQQWEQILNNGRSDIDAEATFIEYNSTNSRVVITGFYKYPSGESKITTFALNGSNGSVVWQNTYPSLALTVDRPVRLHESGNNIWVYGTRTIGAATQYITIKYEVLERSQTIIEDEGLEYVENEVIIKFDPEELDMDFINNRQSQFADLEDIVSPEVYAELEPIISGEGQFTSTGIKVFKRLTAENTESITRLGKTIPIPDFWATLVITTNVNPLTILEELNEVEGVEYAELNRILSFELFPDDFVSDQQSFFNGEFSADDINADRAWDVQTGGTHVRVGVVDAGIYWDHEDFDVGGLGTFESSKIEGGWDYANNYEVWNDDNNSAISFGHGTWVAGIYGAISNNNLGIAGLAGGSFELGDPATSGIQLFDLEIGIADGGGEAPSFELAAEAVIEAATFDPSGGFGFGVNILNYSIGTYGLDTETKLLMSSVEFAFKNNVIQVAAKGNDGIDNLYYPSDFNDNYIISVGGSGADGEYETDANFGNTIDLIAPFGNEPLNFTTDNGTVDDYAFVAGTSFSTPLVGGTAALMLSEVNNPDAEPHFENLTHEDIENLLELSASDRDDPGYDENTGWGLLDAQAALEGIDFPHYQVKHFCHTFDDEDYNLDGEDVTISLPYGFGGIAAGTYVADRYKLDEVLPHSLSASAEILDWWTLPSMTNTLTAASPVVDFRNFVMGTPTLTTVDADGYIFLIKHVYPFGATINKYIPFDPFTTDAEMCYSLYIFDDEATAINQIDGQIVYANAFPNPTDNEITIKTNLDQADLFTIEVSNISGQILIKEENVQMTAGNNQTNLNIHNLPTGLYTITLISNHLKTSFKIVKL